MRRVSDSIPDKLGIQKLSVIQEIVLIKVISLC